MSKRKGWTIKSFSISLDDLEVVDVLRKIAAREGLTLSKQIVIALKEYVRRHEPGNPQLLLTSFAEAGIRARQPPPCHGVVKFAENKVYCKVLGYDWIPLKRCWRCWRRRREQP